MACERRSASHISSRIILARTESTLCNSKNTGPSMLTAVTFRPVKHGWMMSAYLLNLLYHPGIQGLGNDLLQDEREF